MEDLIIYKAWPGEEIDRAISEFNEQMHDDAEIEELQAGLRCLDFLTRASELSSIQQARLEGATIEAEMRVSLMAALKFSNHTSSAGVIGDAVKAIKILQGQLRGIDKIIERGKDMDYDEIRERVARIAGRK